MPTTTRVLALALLALVPGCLSPSGGGDAGEDASSGSGEGSSSSGDSSGPGTPTTGDSEDTVAGCGPCADDEACIGSACEVVGRADLERGCNPLGDPAGRGQCVYPWPSDVMTVADAATATGRRVQLDAALLPRNIKDQGFPVALTNDLDGFSPSSQIRLAFAAGVDAADLPGIADIGASIAADAKIVLVQADSGERWPFFAELDATAEPGEPVTVFIRPMRRLDLGKRYVVGVRGLHDQTGQEIAAPPLFRALRDELTTDVPQLEALRDDYKDVFAALADAGVERGALQLAWSFTTVSAEVVQRDLTAIVPQVQDQAGAGDLGYALEQVEIQPDPALARVIHGTFTVPNCLTGDAGPGALLQRGPDGAPACEGTTEARMWIAIPQAVWDKGSPVPFVVYGHGLLGSGDEAISIARQATSTIVAGTDFWGMSEADIPILAEQFGSNLGNGATIPERLLQSAVNFTALGYLAQGELLDEAELMVFQNDTFKTLIDPTQIQYLGGSQGGIMGGTVVAMAPNIQRGTLVVGGANYSLMIWRSSSFAQLDQVWAGSQPDPQDRELLFAVYQSIFDRSDPLIYADLITQPLLGGDPKRLMLIESIGDSQVPNIATEMMARSYGMPLMAPGITEVWGVKDQLEALETGSALFQVDTGKGPPPPTQNLPPADDNGAHGAAVDDPKMIEIIERFMFKGIFENLCDGPCDPG